MHEIDQLNYSLLHSISLHTKYLNRNSIKNKLFSLRKKKQQKSKKFNLYGKLTKAKSFFFEEGIILMIH